MEFLRVVPLLTTERSIDFPTSASQQHTKNRMRDTTMTPTTTPMILTRLKRKMKYD